MKIPYHPPYLRDIDTWRLRSLAAHKPLAACCKRIRTTLSGWLCAAEGPCPARQAGRRASEKFGPLGPHARLQAAHLHSQAVGPIGF